MTIGINQAIIGQDVEDLVNAHYPDYVSFIPVGGLKGLPFVADGLQNYATAVALVAMGTTARAKGDDGKYTFVNDDTWVTSETTGTNVMAANQWFTATGYGTSDAAALADAISKLNASGVTLGQLTSHYTGDASALTYTIITHYTATGSIKGQTKTYTTSGSDSDAFVSGVETYTPYTDSLTISETNPPFSGGYSAVATINTSANPQVTVSPGIFPDGAVPGCVLTITGKDIIVPDGTGVAPYRVIINRAARV